MRKPDESLDDYNVTPSRQITSKPPREVTLQRTGKVKVLTPLTAREVFQHFGARRQPLWFRRFLLVGSGALVMTAMILISAILVGINDDGTSVAVYDTPDETVAQPMELFTFDIPQPSTAGTATGEIEVVPVSTKRRPARRISHRTMRRMPPLSQPKFVPTTLIIYAEGGVIKRRIEPWVRSS